MGTKIIVGGGCFWCIQAVFKEIQGVLSAISGYAGGHNPNPRYEEVCSGLSGHTEVVEITFESQQVNLMTILRLFFLAHNPTQIDRQGNDVGEQYRSIIYYTNKDQLPTIQDTITAIAPSYNKPISTLVYPLENFYPAEEYHQDYFANNPTANYCQAIIAPKVNFVKEHIKANGYR